MNPNDVKIGDIVRFSNNGVRITEIVLEKHLNHFTTFCLKHNQQPKSEKTTLKLNFIYINHDDIKIIS